MLFLLLLFVSRVTAQEFTLVPEELHHELTKSVRNSGRSHNNGKRATTCITATNSRKKESERAKTSQEVKAPMTRKNIQKRALRSIKILNPHQTKTQIETSHTSLDIFERPQR